MCLLLLLSGTRIVCAYFSIESNWVARCAASWILRIESNNKWHKFTSLFAQIQSRSHGPVGSAKCLRFERTVEGIFGWHVSHFSWITDVQYYAINLRSKNRFISSISLSGVGIDAFTSNSHTILTRKMINCSRGRHWCMQKQHAACAHVFFTASCIVCRVIRNARQS